METSISCSFIFASIHLVTRQAEEGSPAGRQAESTLACGSPGLERDFRMPEAAGASDNSVQDESWLLYTQGDDGPARSLCLGRHRADMISRCYFQEASTLATALPVAVRGCRS